MSTETFEATITRDNEFDEQVELAVEVEVDVEDYGEQPPTFDERAVVITRDGEEVYDLCPCTQRPSILTGQPMPSLLINPNSEQIARLCADADCQQCGGTGRLAKRITLTCYELQDIQEAFARDLADREQAAAERAAEEHDDARRERRATA